MPGTLMEIDDLPTSSGRYDELLKAPSSAPDAQPLQRATAPYQSHDERFVLQGPKAFDQQYSSIYFFRLKSMRPLMVQRVQQQWPSVPVVTILDLPEGREVAVVGTVYKDMKLKPSILDEYVKERGLAAHTGGAKLTAPDDTIVLEDEGARMVLRGGAAFQVPIGSLVTGVVMVVRGTAAPGGDFEVSGMLLPEMAPQPCRPPPSQGPAKYVALVSGLGIGDTQAQPLRVQLLGDFLTGELGGPDDQQRVAQVVRTVVAGGLMRGGEALSQGTTHASSRQQAAALAPVRELDIWLSQLAAAMPIDVLPGAGDPSNHSLPQQPLHRCLFPGAAAYPTFVRGTNPHEFEVEGVRLLGTSGQNVDDIRRYSDVEDRLEMLELLVRWRHLVPTAPDTLTAYPYQDQDPFLLTSTPHVLFAGNQPEFATRTVTGADGQEVRLICVPNFGQTGQLVLLNLSTLAAEALLFDTSYVV